MATLTSSVRGPRRTPRTRRNVEMRMHQVEVRRVHRLSPGMTRITLGAESLRQFLDDGPDQRCKLFLPRSPANPDTLHALLGDDQWYQAWLRLPDDVRPVMRTYTVRCSRPEVGEVDVDFVLHGDGGPASAWAAQARPGDHVALYGPRAEYAPAAGAQWRLLIGDATALPAIGAIVAMLPVGTRAHVFLEVESALEEQALLSCADVTITWLHLGTREAGNGRLLEAVRGAALPAGRVAAWVAGESAMVRSLRRHLVSERGYPATDVQFMAYWRLGAAVDPD